MFHFLNFHDGASMNVRKSMKNDSKSWVEDFRRKLSYHFSAHLKFNTKSSAFEASHNCFVQENKNKDINVLWQIAAIFRSCNRLKVKLI